MILSSFSLGIISGAIVGLLLAIGFLICLFYSMRKLVNQSLLEQLEGIARVSRANQKKEIVGNYKKITRADIILEPHDDNEDYQLHLD